MTPEHPVWVALPIAAPALLVFAVWVLNGLLEDAEAFARKCAAMLLMSFAGCGFILFVIWFNS